MAAALHVDPDRLCDRLLHTHVRLDASPPVALVATVAYPHVDLLYLEPVSRQHLDHAAAVFVHLGPAVCDVVILDVDAGVCVRAVDVDERHTLRSG